MRASLRSTSSFPGVNGSFGSYYRYPGEVGEKQDGKHKIEVDTFPENNNRGRNLMNALKLYSVYKLYPLCLLQPSLQL